MLFFAGSVSKKGQKEPAGPFNGHAASLCMVRM